MRSGCRGPTGQRRVRVLVSGPEAPPCAVWSLELGSSQPWRPSPSASPLGLHFVRGGKARPLPGPDELAHQTG